MDAAERSLLEATVRDALGGASRADDVLTDLGWADLLATEPRDAIDVVFTALGAGDVTAGVLDDVLATALGIEPRADIAVVLPPFAAWDPPGDVDGDRVHVRGGLATARALTASHLLVVCEAAGATPRLAAVPVAAVAAGAPVRGLDPRAGLQRVEVSGHASSVTPLEPAAWETAVAAGRRALAHQIAGASRAMLDLARTHALERVQFGRPIARFQAVRHRLAEALVAVEALESALAASWDDPGPLTAALAKAAAGRTAGAVGAHAQQVLAGTGFTTEHPFHRFLKRTMVLDGLLGSADAITLDLGRRLLASRTVPTLLEL
jgi:hypothetical protein